MRLIFLRKGTITLYTEEGENIIKKLEDRVKELGELYPPMDEKTMSRFQAIVSEIKQLLERLVGEETWMTTVSEEEGELNPMRLVLLRKQLEAVDVEQVKEEAAEQVEEEIRRRLEEAIKEKLDEIRNNLGTMSDEEKMRLAAALGISEEDLNLEQF